jgi:Galactose oxidase, central domain/Kelch motif
MSAPRDFDGIVREWLESGPTLLSERAFEAAMTEVHRTRQRRPIRLTWRLSAMNMPTRLAAVTVIGVVAVGAALILTRPGQPAVGGPSPAPGVIANPSATASPSANPTSSVVPARAASWTATGIMGYERHGATATLLPDGKVLVAGGGSMFVYGSGTSAEVYDPGTGSWTATASMGYDRQGATVTLLPDGKVLVAGGSGGPGNNSSTQILASAEVYDPRTGTWSPTGKMGAPRGDHSATLLPDGRVLVVGGFNELGAKSYAPSLATAELYDPASGTWTPTGSMGSRRAGPTATLLPDGKVLVAGGLLAPTGSVASAELYDPSTGTWAPTGNMSTKRQGSTATLLPDGRVLVAGGSSLTGAGTVVLATAELYDPGTGTWTQTGKMRTPGGDTATLLPDGMVLVTGGGNGTAAQLYDPGSGTWTSTASMGRPRSGQTATLLADGRALVAGGNGQPGCCSPTVAELYDPGSP